MTENRFVLASLSLLVALIAYIATCGTARAEPHTIAFRHPGPGPAYEAIETPWGVVPVACEPGSTCSVVVDIPWGQYPGVTIKGVVAVEKSKPSNALDRKVYQPLIERADFDNDGHVSVASDFVQFLRVLGKRWTPTP